jgi:16S rRNA (guanine966-N2)-methyltransferase
VRVVAGELRGRSLRAPRGDATRPTSDRVREALFSILHDVRGARVLDLFAGSGALGIEALSRGASEAEFVDAAPAAHDAVRANLAALGLSAQVHRRDALSFLSAARNDGRQYDLLFLDPPYRHAKELAEALSAALPGVLAPGARVVAESDRRAPLHLELPIPAATERRYGDTLIRIYGP